MVKLTKDDIINKLKSVKDPEIPTISIVDLGIVTKVLVNNNKVEVVLTPTFSGCPALKIIEDLTREALLELPNVISASVTTNFDDPWNTNKISDEGLKALKKHGLAPPPKHQGYVELDVLSETPCPFCDSHNTTLQTPFGPTLCRAIHYCKNCSQAFESFKPLS